MVDQATVTNGKANPESATQEVARGVGELGADILQLVELQGQLVKADLAIAFGKIVRPLLCIAISMLFVIASVPLVLVALAEAIVQFAELDRMWAYLIVGGVTLVAAGISILLTINGLKHFTAFETSRAELANNLRYLKTMWKAPRWRKR